MPNRFSRLVAGLSLLLIVFSGCTPWGRLGSFEYSPGKSKDDANAESHQRDYADESASNPSDDFPHQSDSPPLDAREFGQTQRNEASKNDFLLGRRAEDAGELEAAKQLYQNVLRKHPTHAHAHHRLGVVADKMQRFAEAERHYQAALNYMSPDNRQEISIVFSDLGYSYLLRGDFPKSERALTNALAYDENSRIAVRNLALLHGYRGDFEKAYQTFASVGGEAEARAELDRLFPQWQDDASADPTAIPASSSAPSLAANDMLPQPPTNSSAFPTSLAPESRRFPEPTLRSAPPVASSRSSQHLTFDTEPAVDPNSSFTTGQSAFAERIATNSTATGQPLQAPPPQGHLSETMPRDFAVPPVQSPAIQYEADPARHVTQAAYSDDEPRNLRQQPVTAPEYQNLVRPKPRVAIHIDEIQTGPSIPASRAALILGGAVGPGGMFPTSQIEPPQSIQQVSAEDPGATRFTQNSYQPVTQNAPPTSTARYGPPANGPTGLIRSPNPATDRTRLIPSPNVVDHQTVPLGDYRQPPSPSSGAVPPSYSAPQIQPAYHPVQ